MKIVFHCVALVALLVGLTACSTSSNPGALAGTWRLYGDVPMTITFRKGETEAMGMIEQVSYKQDGNDILVTSLDGFAKGTSFRYTVIDGDTLKSQLGTLRRIQ